MSANPVIFISCGQYTQSERKLGKNIASLVRQIHPDVVPYFAENQSTVQALSSNILQSLQNAAGFVCVMHKRGEIARPDGGVTVRGSVWIEQEIAIVAFIEHVLGRSIPTFFYKEAGVGIEGIRSVLLLNPRLEFTADAQILEDLGEVLRSHRFVPFRAIDLEPEIKYKMLNGRSTSEHRVYSMTIDLRDVGQKLVRDFRLNIFFPRLFLATPYTMWAADTKRSTKSHLCFPVSLDRVPGGLYPKQGLDTPVEIEYFVDDNLFHDPEAMRSQIELDLYVDSTTKKYHLPIKEYQSF